MQEFYPQYNYIQVTKDYFFTANGVWELKWRRWGYYVFAIDHSLPMYKIRYEDNIIYCSMDTLRSVLRFGQRDTDVFILFKDKGTFLETTEMLSNYFTKYFWKVWEGKSYNTLYCRNKWAKVWGKVMLANNQATSPELCKVWWHGCYNVSEAMSYKLDDVRDKMYITNMTAHSIVDYWEDKVCCLKASFPSHCPFNICNSSSVARVPAPSRRWLVRVQLVAKKLQGVYPLWFLWLLSPVL